MAQEFRCKACGAEFDTKDKLDQHNRQQHPSMTPGGGTTPTGT
ncbi:MAG: hypothetical protein ACT4PM_02305 [Gemmatimonadales bacterium]